MPWNKIPDVDKCCACVPDLKTAVTIIAVLGIVTSPAVSWAVIRHSYMIRVSCVITANDARPDVVDVNLNNVLSFGFGANAGIGSSCLGPHQIDSSVGLVIAVKYLGWVALLFDLLFLASSIYLLIVINREDHRKPVKIFMVCVTLSIMVSFIYAMLYVSACLQIGGSFPVFEFIFAFVDMGLWTYFLIVVRSYRHKNITNPATTVNRIIQRVETIPTSPTMPRAHDNMRAKPGVNSNVSHSAPSGMTFHTHTMN
ncbi:uncharacterized protein LOC128672480 [Plodia interpunctella]|uniref:uncharacterized protein LOC128672480 n=1 Tax=Plodia interpunctella TaxID=58824 RepID=UPI002367C3E1|nr:uncharacterized protein LOC128672480 [Plodia interpunctella]